jgi:hypothetical protein
MMKIERRFEMSAKFCSKHKSVNIVMVVLLAVVILMAGAGSQGVSASPQLQQTCGGTIQYGQSLDQQNTSTWPHCDYWFDGKDGERITIKVDTLGNHSLYPQIVLFVWEDNQAKILYTTNPNDSLYSYTLQLRNFRLDRGDKRYGFRVTYAFGDKPEHKYGAFRVSLINETVNGINIRSGRSLKCLYPDTYSPHAVGQWTCDGGMNQWWYAEPVGSGHTYRIHSSGNQTYAYCLDVAGSSKATSAQIVGNLCNTNSLSQQWRLGNLIDGKRELINVNSGLCLDLPNGSSENRTIIQQYPCVSSKYTEYNQLWNFVESFGYVVLYDKDNCSGNLAARPVGNAKGYGLYNFTDGIQQQENGLQNDKAISIRMVIKNDAKRPVWIGLYNNTDPARNSGARMILNPTPKTGMNYSDSTEYCTNILAGDLRGKVSWMVIAESQNQLP